MWQSTRHHGSKKHLFLARIFIAPVAQLLQISQKAPQLQGRSEPDTHLPHNFATGIIKQQTHLHDD